MSWYPGRVQKPSILYSPEDYISYFLLYGNYYSREKKMLNKKEIFNRQPSTLNPQPPTKSSLQYILQIPQTFIHILAQHTGDDQVHKIHGIFILTHHLPYYACLSRRYGDRFHRNTGRVLK